mmetsp:Transcript_22728/g.37619  ORF Transcript_22728/g.37619 Transcript_22728/m.37619 type:complete len:197 (-) Transcript_22728:149-739(-)|eukprot:CAMPEP_0119012542 /NCGR_PEP_ID=MMETSP1176-20130426/6892_1 /TAXON_ID=265551 /ORGANISM="Synedropsis recta cf, Strain CCMP1620" /LENGTH=196 /DNA_ID=CAMNT_0006965525 /DNA_START=133 /DNA_END=723 /DNA_ORIENTATION=+
MTLSSLLNDGLVLNISYTTQQKSQQRSNSFAWSDIPVVGDYSVPLEQNQELMEGQPDYIPISASSSEASFISTEVEEAPSKRPKGHKKSVSFNQFLEIREHALTIGDHPLCRDALPLSLAWEHGETELMELNQYEEVRSGFRRSGNQMKLSYYERKNMLRKIAGMTEADMRDHQRMHQSLPSASNLSCFSGLSTSN